MTRMTNARVAGSTFLAYIAFGIGSMALFGKATRGQGIAGKLAQLADHAGDVRLAVILTLLCGLSAIVLAVSLHAITRDADPDLAMLGLTCRVAEGVVGGASVQRSLSLLWLATATGPDMPAGDSARALGAFLLQGQGWGGTSATFFAVGSTFFAVALLRGRVVPVWMAWLGVVASLLLVVLLPLQVAGFLRGGFFTGPVSMSMWLPMLLFEIALALWLIVKGAAPARLRPAS
jgi:hypothetical protein